LTAQSSDRPRARWRDPAAAGPVVTALYEDHALGLIRLAYVMLGDRQAAEDVVQDAFAGLYRRWDDLADPRRALTYVRSCVLNGSRSALRRRAVRQAVVTYDPPAISAEAAVLTTEERRGVMRALRALPRRQREILVLRFYLDLPDEQIAATLGIRQSTVRSAAYRGLRALRTQLTEETS
jgi:RNA polymerase sigma-70 factor (sigma-E family)